MIGLEHYLTVAATLFVIGIFGLFLNRKNIIILLMSIELMFNGVNITAVALSRYVVPAALAQDPDAARRLQLAEQYVELSLGENIAALVGQIVEEDLAASPDDAPLGIAIASRASRSVRNMLVPVSPSGPGKTLRGLMASTFFSSSASAEANMPRRSSPSRRVLGALG